MNVKFNVHMHIHLKSASTCIIISNMFVCIQDNNNSLVEAID